MSDLRIGVFVCHCGTNIGGVVDVPDVADYASGLDDVVCAKHNLYTCSDAGLREIKESIEEHDLNRVVVASCTPRTHESLFRSTCEEAGLNKFLFEFVNIRDQCSWVHIQDPERATEKAKDLVRMGVAKSRLLEPMEDIEIDVLPVALVIGGGIAGMSAALSMANMGITSYLVEREPELGGMLNKLYALYPSHITAKEFIEPVKEAVLSHPKIKVMTATEITDVRGFIGNYEVAIQTFLRKNFDQKTKGTEPVIDSTFLRENFDQKTKGEEPESVLKVGAIIVATGARAHIPEGEYGYNARNVVTQLEFEQILKKGIGEEGSEDDRKRLKDLKNIVMIQCVGARSDERRYCSRICCSAAVKNSVLLKEANPDTQVYILFRDIQTYTSSFEDYYFAARDKGVIFIRYSRDRRPEVDDSIVRIYDELLGVELGVPYDLLVLSTPLVPYDNAKELATMLKVPLDENGFFLEAHVKLRPVDFATDGIYLAGCAHWPVHVGEAVSQAQAAASRAAIPLLNGRVRTEPIISRVNEELCIGCALCESLCPFKAIQVVMTEVGRKARVITASCKGCGACGAACPHHAISMQHFTDAQIEAQIDALVGL